MLGLSRGDFTELCWGLERGLQAANISSRQPPFSEVVWRNR